MPELEPLQLPVQRGAADAEGLGCRRNIAVGAQQRPLQHARWTRRQMVMSPVRRRAGRPRAPAATGGRARDPKAQRARTGSRRSRDRRHRPRRRPPTWPSAPCVSTMRAWAKARRNRSASMRLAASPPQARSDWKTHRSGRRGRRRHRARPQTPPRGRRSEPPCSSISVLRREEMLVAVDRQRALLDDAGADTVGALMLLAPERAGPQAPGLKRRIVRRPCRGGRPARPHRPRAARSSRSRRPPDSSRSIAPCAAASSGATRSRACRNSASLSRIGGRGPRDRDDAIGTNGAMRPPRRGARRLA